MIRTLTAGWVPYSTWTERGSLRHCLLWPENLQTPPTAAAQSIEACFQPLSRRRMLQYSVAGAAACGVIGYGPATCQAGIFQLFGQLAQRFLVPALKWCLKQVIYTLAESVLRAAANKVVEYLGLNDNDFSSRLQVAAKPVLQGGPESQFHSQCDDLFKFPNEGEYALVVPRTEHKDFGNRRVGLDGIQWDINENAIEMNQMRARESAFVHVSFRRKGFSDNLRTKLRLANELYVNEKDGDRPYTPDEVVYTVPSLASKRKEIVGFGVMRNSKVEFLYV